MIFTMEQVIRVFGLPSSAVGDGLMLVEIARPVTLLLSILSLYAVFHAAFLAPGSNFDQKIWNSLGLLVLAAVVALVSGLVFRKATPHPAGTRLRSTLPVQLFCWAAGVMLILFVVSWYLESYCVFYRDKRWW